jgi:translation initiation factor 1
MSKRRSTNSGLVYSSEHGRMCPQCGKPAGCCSCKQQNRQQNRQQSQQQQPAGDGIVRVGRSTKGRKGKGVSVITGVPLTGAALDQLARELKQRCGSGGTVKDGVIEIQGEHRDLLVQQLQERGYTAKRSGG